MTHKNHEHEGAVRQTWSGEGSCRVLLIGEDNPQSSDPEHALYPLPAGCAGNRLQSSILMVAPATYLGLWRTNLCNPTWSMPAARARACHLMSLNPAPWNTIVMLGAKVARAFEYPRPVFTSCRLRLLPDRTVFDLLDLTFSPEPGEFQLVYLPHPSGRCRSWNDPAAPTKARMLMRACVPEIGWGAQ